MLGILSDGKGEKPFPSLFRHTLEIIALPLPQASSPLFLWIYVRATFDDLYHEDEWITRCDGAQVRAVKPRLMQDNASIAYLVHYHVS